MMNTTTMNAIDKMNKKSLEWWKRVLDIQLSRGGFGKVTFNDVQYTNYSDIQALKNAVSRKLREIA